MFLLFGQLPARITLLFKAIGSIPQNFTLKDPLCGRRAAAWPELATNFFWLDQPSGCDIAELDELFNPARSIALDRECFVVRLGIPVVIAPLDQQKHGFQ